MKRMTSTLALAALGAGVAFTPSVAFAQDADDQPETETPQPRERQSAIGAATGEIIVTATKSKDAENVQDVPLAVTAFNSESLEALKVRDVQSLTYSAPNVSLDQIGTARGTANFSIRGLGINSSIPSIDPTVGVFVDGVFLGFNAGVVFDLFDLESIEIVRGPQGILFGRNTTGGAVLINTGNPTDEFRAKFRASVDGPFLDDGRGGANFTVGGTVSGPLVQDALNFKLGAYHNNDDGYFTNQFDGSNHGAAETTILRGALEYDDGGPFSLLGKLEYFTSEGDGPSAQNHGIFERGESFDFSIDFPGFYDNEIWTGSLRADLDIGPGTLTNIFGYRTYEGTTGGDIDASPAFLFHSNTETEQDQISNEIRYAFDLDRFSATVGGFYFDQSIQYTEIRNLFGGAANFFGGGEQDHEVLGLFAQGEFEVATDFSLIAGLRWSRETKDAAVSYIIPSAPCSVVDGTCPTGPGDGFVDDNEWESLSPKFGFQYDGADVQVYGHWTRGFRSGGYNFRITNPVVFETVVVPSTGGFSFDEEQVDNYELGAKLQTADRRGTLNLAVYRTDIANMQREVNQSSITAGVSQFILNTADAQITGVEAEGRYQILDNLLLSGNVGYINAEYQDVLFDISSDGVINGDDLALSLPRVPEWTYGVGLIHELFLGSSEIVSRINYQHRDQFAYTDNNFGWILPADNLDANITWNTPVEGLAFSIYGKNLLDEIQHGGDTQLPFPGPLGNGINEPFGQFPAAGTFSPLSRGRVVGVEVSYEFFGN